MDVNSIYFMRFHQRRLEWKDHLLPEVPEEVHQPHTFKSLNNKLTVRGEVSYFRQSLNIWLGGDIGKGLRF